MRFTWMMLEFSIFFSQIFFIHPQSVRDFGFRIPLFCHISFTMGMNLCLFFFHIKEKMLNVHVQQDPMSTWMRGHVWYFMYYYCKFTYNSSAFYTRRSLKVWLFFWIKAEEKWKNIIKAKYSSTKLTHSQVFCFFQRESRKYSTKLVNLIHKTSFRWKHRAMKTTVKHFIR